jgi:hypothetical protein
MPKIYRDKYTGKKLYPVCSWENNQHILYNALDRAHNAVSDLCEDKNATSEQIDKADEWVEEVQRLLEVFDSHVASNGLVYATWEDGLKIKDIIWAYNARH